MPRFDWPECAFSTTTRRIYAACLLYATSIVLVGYRCTTVVSLSIASISSMTADYRHYTSYCFESTIRDEQVSQSVRHSRGRPRLRLRAGMKEGRNRVKEGKPEESEVSRNFNRVRRISRPNSTASIGCSGDLSNYYCAIPVGPTDF
jgi:hypothetical protein